jgi:hypothetical protein
VPPFSSIGNPNLEIQIFNKVPILIQSSHSFSYAPDFPLTPPSPPSGERGRGSDVFLHGLQSPPKMSFFMRFEGVKRTQFRLRKESKELAKVEFPFSHREMLIHLFVIIVEVNLTQEPSQGFYPSGERSLGEDILMARVEAESKMG